MMAHFAKLQTPLGAVRTYPSTDAQEQRFKDLGWPTASAVNLWQLWSSPEFLTAEERKALDSVEPFDEWEEFALFGCHYFLLVAENTQGLSKVKTLQSRNSSSRRNLIEAMPAHMTYSENPKVQGLRRFAAALPIRVSGHPEDGVGNFAGMGAGSRIASYDIYASSHAENRPKISHNSGSAPSSRMCHTITDLGDIGSLLVGGRTSPDNALADCWLYHKFLNIWERIEDLPLPRYRHSALNLGHGCVLVSSGRSNSREVGRDFFVWSRHSGWRMCACDIDAPPPITYGVVFSVFDDPASKSVKSGLLAGGLSEDGVVEQDIWEWKLHDFTSHVSQSLMLKDSR
jgi:tRNA wybutosine-synthesizing protein 4